MRRPIPVLAALIALLVPAGAFAAATVSSGEPAPAGGRSVGAAGLTQEQLVPERVTTPSIGPQGSTTTVMPAPATTLPPAPTTTVARRSTATAPPPATGPTTTVATLLPGLPLPPLPPIPPLLQLPPILQIPPILQSPASSWSTSANGITIRMRMEPTAPVAGQPVSFHIEVATQGACCAMTLSYGDGFAGPSGGNCDSPKSRTVTMTHTFAAPGDYELLLFASTFPCNGSVVDGQRIEPTIDAAGITACIGVSRLLGPPSCTRYNHFGPGTIYT